MSPSEKNILRIKKLTGVKSLTLTNPYTKFVESNTVYVVTYAGNTDNTPEQFAQYSLHGVYSAQTEATYTSAHSLPLLPGNRPIKDIGPTEYSAVLLGNNFFAWLLAWFFALFNHLFCEPRRQAKIVTVTPDVDRSSNAKDPYLHIPLFWRMSLGQKSDIDCHAQRFEAVIQFAKNASQDQTLQPDLLFYGISRGAATSFTATTQNIKEYQKKANVKALVLEGAFAEVQNDIKSKVWFNDWIISWFIEHRPSGITPIKAVDNFPKDVPVLFISSKADTGVSYKSTERLAQALAKRGKNDVYLVTLEHSPHTGYMCENEEDQRKYLCATHAFYRAHGAYAYYEELADLGDGYLKDAKLSPAEAANTEPAAPSRSVTAPACF